MDQQVEYERYFKEMMHPWTIQDLKIKCDDCGIESEDVSDYSIEADNEGKHLNLCEKCYGKRTSESDDDSTETRSVSSELGEIDLSTPEKCHELIDRIKALQGAGRIESGLATTLIQTINNSIAAHKLREKTHDDAKTGPS